MKPKTLRKRGPGVSPERGHLRVENDAFVYKTNGDVAKQWENKEKSSVY